MKSVKLSELTVLSNTELLGRIDDYHKELFNLRFQKAQGQLSDTNVSKSVRRTIARIKTIMRQRELAAQEKKA